MRRHKVKSPGNRLVSEALLLSGREDLNGVTGVATRGDASRNVQISGQRGEGGEPLADGGGRLTPRSTPRGVDASGSASIGDLVSAQATEHARALLAAVDEPCVDVLPYADLLIGAVLGDPVVRLARAARDAGDDRAALAEDLARAVLERASARDDRGRGGRR